MCPKPTPRPTPNPFLLEGTKKGVEELGRREACSSGYVHECTIPEEAQLPIRPNASLGCSRRGGWHLWPPPCANPSRFAATILRAQAFLKKEKLGCAQKKKNGHQITIKRVP